jgi:hypothetical protein
MAGDTMEHFQATVRLLDLVEPDAGTVKRTVEERLRFAGFTRWQIVRVLKEGAAPARVNRPLRAWRPPSYVGGKLLMAGVVAWSLWLLWLIAG